MDAPTFSETIIARLLGRISMAGTSLSALSKSMGRAHSYLGRKLSPASPSEARELSVTEVDDILAALGLPPTALDEPALAPADRHVLAWAARTSDGERTLAAAAALFAGLRRILDRLSGQRLLVLDGERIHLTEEGMRYADLAAPVT